VAYWTLTCGNCGSNFVHSLIEDDSVLNFLFPSKPKFPDSGSELECPNCRRKTIYKRTDLTYARTNP
jgi:DNA-directed RNA polymerase subunit RPC12/RpoP